MRKAVYNLTMISLLPFVWPVIVCILVTWVKWMDVLQDVVDKLIE